MAQSNVRSAPPSRATQRRARGLAIALAFSVPLLGAADAHAAGVPIEQATAEQKTAAQQAFQAGIKLFDAKQFGPAFKEFSSSYDVVKSPNAHFMMARCLTEMGELARAFNELLVVEDEARTSPKYKTTLNESSQLRQELARKVAVIVISLKGAQDATVTVDGAQVPLRKQHAVSPGEVEIVATVHGEARKRERVNLLPGDVRPMSLEVGDASAGTSDVTPPPAGDGNGNGDVSPRPETPSNDGGGNPGLPWYIAGGVTGGLAVGLGVATLVNGLGFLDKKSNNNSSEESKYNNEHPGEGGCTDSNNNVGTAYDCEAVAQSTRAIGFGVAAGVAAVLGTSFLIVGATRGGGDEDANAINVQVVPGPGGVTVLGTF